LKCSLWTVDDAEEAVTIRTSGWAASLPGKSGLAAGRSLLT